MVEVPLSNSINDFELIRMSCKFRLFLFNLKIEFWWAHDQLWMDILNISNICCYIYCLFHVRYSSVKEWFCKNWKIDKRISRFDCQMFQNINKRGIFLSLNWNTWENNELKHKKGAWKVENVIRFYQMFSKHCLPQIWPLGDRN